MAIFINVRFEEEGTGRVAALQKELADLGVSKYAEWLGYPPHMTLARVEDARVEQLVSSAERLAHALPGLSLVLGALGLFGGPTPVVWLSPVASVALLNAHQQLCSDLEEIGVHTNYRPGNWIPHVTVAAELSIAQTSDAVSALIPLFTPIRTRPNAVEIVSFPPAQVLSTILVG